MLKKHCLDVLYIKVHALLTVHQLCDSEHLLLEPILWYVNVVLEVTQLRRCQCVTKFVLLLSLQPTFATCDMPGQTVCLCK